MGERGLLYGARPPFPTFFPLDWFSFSATPKPRFHLVYLLLFLLTVFFSLMSLLTSHMLLTNKGVAKPLTELEKKLGVLENLDALPSVADSHICLGLLSP